MSKVAKSESRPSVISRKPPASKANHSLSGLSWRLPSGESLAEFALRFGFLAPRLLSSEVVRCKGLINIPEAR